MSDAAAALANRARKSARSAGISFWELREGRCRFPLGLIHEPPTLFCGAPAVIGVPYCPDCGRLAYAPSSRR
ncbi:MAG: GcrA family cell cycle regulator [Methylocystis sp.]|uniref:GcrA family cell cycle regulator n=1 Tax=Methylocystis sp. TaxID=1911079 RepID=UPI003DA2066E